MAAAPTPPPPDDAGPLPSLREVIARHGLTARKSLGQHFLLDPQILARIARAAGDLSGRTVLEVGPGPGGLTRALLAAGAARVVAVERDPRFVAALAELAEWAGGDRLRVVEADALEVDEAALAGPPPLTVVANLPYNVATPLLLKWLGRPHLFAGFTLMVQREVAERLTAAPGGKAYGRLSVMVRWRAEVEHLFGLPAGAFVPPPKVASSLIRVTPRPAPRAEAEPAAMERVVAAAFAQRRKMLRVALRALVPDPEPLLAAAGVPPTARAERLDVAAFAALARAYRGGAGLSATGGAPGAGARTRSDPAGGGGAAARRRGSPEPGRG